MRCLRGPEPRQQWIPACGTHAHRTRSQHAAEPGRHRQGFGGQEVMRPCPVIPAKAGIQNFNLPEFRMIDDTNYLIAT